MSEPFRISVPSRATEIYCNSEKLQFHSIKLFCTFYFYSRSNFVSILSLLIFLSRVNISQQNKIIRAMIVNKKLPFRYDKIYVLIIECGGRYDDYPSTAG